MRQKSTNIAKGLSKNRQPERTPYARPEDRVRRFETVTGKPDHGSLSYLLMERAATSLVRIADRFEVTKLEVVNELGIFHVTVDRFKRDDDQAQEKIRRFLLDRSLGFPEPAAEEEL